MSEDKTLGAYAKVIRSWLPDHIIENGVWDEFVLELEKDKDRYAQDRQTEAVKEFAEDVRRKYPSHSLKLMTPEQLGTTLDSLLDAHLQKEGKN